MAGNGPAPTGTAARRNNPKIDELDAAGYQGEYPALPKRYSVGINPETGRSITRTFTAETRDWYETWARSPMATQFTGVWWKRLQLLARLVDGYVREPSTKLLSEIRLNEAGFGGTPYDLRRLGKRIKLPAQPATTGGDREPAARTTATGTTLNALS